MKWINDWRLVCKTMKHTRFCCWWRWSSKSSIVFDRLLILNLIMIEVYYCFALSCNKHHCICEHKIQNMRKQPTAVGQMIKCLLERKNVKVTPCYHRILSNIRWCYCDIRYINIIIFTSTTEQMVVCSWAAYVWFHYQDLFDSKAWRVAAVAVFRDRERRKTRHPLAPSTVHLPIGEWQAG